MKFKVYLDTSTLIAGSVLLTSKLVGVDIKDAFYDEATRLISLIKKHVNKRIGITTFASEDEAYQVLSKAIERKLNQRISDRKKVFELLSIATNACESRLKEILSFVAREPINPAEAAYWFIRVSFMYDDLYKIASNLPKPAYFQAGVVPRFLNKAEMFEIYRNQDECLNAQLTNLIYNRVDDNDKMILAQAICLHRLYMETSEKVTTYLSSTDHHFVPVKRKGYVSKQVTDEIAKRFYVIAERPQEIFLTLKKNGL